MSKTENSMIAVGLEVAPGTLLGTFGVGHMYQGRMKAGLLFMVSYWCLQAINVMFVPFGFGVITGFLTWLAYVVVASTDVLKTGR